MSKNKKDKLILKSGNLSQSKVKSFEEQQDNTNTIVSRGKDITYNQL